MSTINICICHNYNSIISYFRYIKILTYSSTKCSYHCPNFKRRKILSILCFSTFIILPLNGRIAWNFLSLPCFAEPPAESPSTRYISHSLGSFDAQSANFPGSVVVSSIDFLLVILLLFLQLLLLLLHLILYLLYFYLVVDFLLKHY